jgi:hypothetical protein
MKLATPPVQPHLPLKQTQQTQMSTTKCPLHLCPTTRSKLLQSTMDQPHLRLTSTTLHRGFQLRNSLLQHAQSYLNEFRAGHEAKTLAVIICTSTLQATTLWARLPPKQEFTHWSPLSLLKQKDN